MGRSSVVRIGLDQAAQCAGFWTSLGMAATILSAPSLPNQASLSSASVRGGCDANFDEADRLGLEAGDTVIVSDGRPQDFWWCGQNRRTGEIGSFPRGIVQRDSKLSSEDISRPLASSFIHADHVGESSVDRLASVTDGRGTPTNRRPSLASAPCMPHSDTGNRNFATTSSLCDDQDTTLVGSTPSTYMNALERLRREQSQGFWTPIPDADSIAGPDFGWTKLASEDGYSLCSSMDQLSLDMQNQLNSPIVTGRYDDQEDEQAILDRTPRATVGSVSCAIKPGVSRANVPSVPVRHAPPFYDPSDYQSPMVLPAPPGPEDETNISTAQTRTISAHNCQSKGFAADYGHPVDHSDPRQSASSLSCDTPSDMPTSVSSRQRSDGRRYARSTYRRSESQPGQAHLSVPGTDPKCSLKSSAQTPAPPLIDLYSPALKPNPLFGSMQFPVPSAPLCDPHLPYYFPPYRRTHWVHFPGAESHQIPPAIPGRPHSVATDPSVSATDPVVTTSSTGPNKTKSIDPFDCARLSNALPDPPPTDNPFDLGTGIPGKNGEHRSVTSTTSTTNLGHTSTLSQSVAQLGPVEQASPGLGSQLISTASHSVTPRSSELVNYPPNRTTVASSSAPVSDEGEAFKDPAPVPDGGRNAEEQQSSLFTSCCTTPNDVSPFVEIMCVCTQLPGVLEDEARQALAHLLNPFISVIPYLVVPPLPSAPLCQSATRVMTEASANRIQLAVRLISANRLHQLGLTTREIGCQVLSAFSWSLPSTAEWLLHRYLCGRQSCW
ncbi:Activated cdc42 kinase 1 [Fasciola gigantica]|uniref:Activated cdc42 kinase 1 n=1 Tax=Fasciola gigantica TaxID=46835 RepID=A0A504YEC8_FASGI|nr:Activated cdc42 kinase 1 [Fasciola gigantica]